MSNVFKVSEAASLGLHAMVIMAADPEHLLSAKGAAGLMKVSEAHLAKVLQRLARAGLVESVRGPKGGFLLTKPAKQTTLLDVYEAIEGPLVVRECLFSTQMCSGQNCIFGDMLKSVDSQVRKYLASTRLSEVTGTVEPILQEARAHDAKA